MTFSQVPKKKNEDEKTTVVVCSMVVQQQPQQQQPQKPVGSWISSSVAVVSTPAFEVSLVIRMVVAVAIVVVAVAVAVASYSWRIWIDVMMEQQHYHQDIESTPQFVVD
jgi:hypothetical protein